MVLIRAEVGDMPYSVLHGMQGVSCPAQASDASQQRQAPDICGTLSVSQYTEGSDEHEGWTH